MKPKPPEPQLGEIWYWYRKPVTVMGEPRDGKVPVLKQDGTYSLARVYDLELLPIHQFRAWWSKNETTLMLMKKLSNGQNIVMSIPKEILPDIRRVMFSKKAMVRESMAPREDEPIPEQDQVQ